MRIDSKTYLNAILTAIALLLLVTALQRPAPVDLAAAAYAQQAPGSPDGQQYLSPTTAGRPASSATEKVADANLEIARQVGEVAKALGDLSRSVDRVALGTTPRP